MELMISEPKNTLPSPKIPGGHSTVKNTGGGWLDSLGSESLVGKDILGLFKNIYLDNSQGVAKMIHMDS